MKSDINVLAYYLPQYHPIPENDEWWGKGFTEWTNVGKAIPLYRNHYQPRVPADLGYYDLRLPEVQVLQADMAREAGISAFCYWHYWFGMDKELLEGPLDHLVQSGTPNFPFCIAWANHSWEKKRWNADANTLSRELLVKQEYQGIEEIDAHFYRLLASFKDKRYYKVNGKNVFVLYNPMEIPYLKEFVLRWQELAQANGLPKFYFVGHAFSKQDIQHESYKSCDAINLVLLSSAVGKIKRIVRTIISYITNRPLNVLDYSKAMDALNDPIMKQGNVFPTIVPNWDASPRLGSVSLILQNSNPKRFYRHVKNVLKLVEHKQNSEKLVFLKSWNEWAEGNYMEPDLVYGKGYLAALKKALSE